MTLSDTVGAVSVVVILGGLAIAINHFQKAGGELTNQIPATPARELAASQQTCVPSTPIKPITVKRDRRSQHTPAHG